MSRRDSAINGLVIRGYDPNKAAWIVDQAAQRLLARWTQMGEGSLEEMYGSMDRAYDAAYKQLGWFFFGASDEEIKEHIGA